jgi:hypothetical protein
MNTFKYNYTHLGLVFITIHVSNGKHIQWNVENSNFYKSNFQYLEGMFWSLNFNIRYV